MAVRHARVADRSRVRTRCGIRVRSSSSAARMVEFYSGVGAARLAFASVLRVERSVAVDNSDVANAVYAANFPFDPPLRMNIEHVDVDAIFAKVSRGSDDAFDDVLWSLAPPCQPYARRGKQLASDDPRALSFLKIVRAIPSIRVAPRWVFVENVRGFETSAARRACVDALRARGYEVKEIIIAPTALGIPYTRERYYLMASLRGFDAKVEMHPAFKGRMLDDDGAVVDASAAREVKLQTLAPYVDVGKHLDDSLLLSPEMIRKYWKYLDVVTTASRRCSTFTAGYASTMFGGSVMLIDDDEGVLSASLDVDIISGIARVREADVERFIGRVRWFDVEEIKRIHGVPASFTFDVAKTNKALFLLGNSMSVDVVREILAYLVRAG